MTLGRSTRVVGHALRDEGRPNYTAAGSYVGSYGDHGKCECGTLFGPGLNQNRIRRLHRLHKEAVAEPNDGPGPDGNHSITGECFACMVGVATGPESHGDGCPFGRRGSGS